MKLGILSLGRVAIGLFWMLSACASGDETGGRPTPNPNGFGNAQPKAGASAGSGGSASFGNPNGQGGSGGSRPPAIHSPRREPETSAAPTSTRASASGSTST